jgi:hypothetical protein
MKFIAVITALGIVATSAASVRASSPEAWAELFKRA